MLFNSIDFLVFLQIAFWLYWFVFAGKREVQNLFVVLASLVFYGWWDWRFLSLLLISSLVDYGVGLGLAGADDPRRRKRLLALSLAANLGLLGFFKYFGFFVDSFIDAAALLGITLEYRTMSIVLPVGISFYTFQTMSYSIDVYRRRMEPVRDFVAFLAFVSFFPQLVAGPIERAERLLPQFLKPREFDYGKAVDGLKQILWGFFKKVVIADNCAQYVNLIFARHDSYSGSTLALGVLLFAFQIYGDFSGYSDIAIGTARLLGFELMRNFAYPYFSRDIAEFWRRWHISLSTWFRDYLYIPLGGSRGGPWKKVRNTLIIFTVSGFWHGANWTFLAWGLLNALYFLPLLFLDANRRNLGIVAEDRFLPSAREALQILTTFLLTLVAWIFFRSESLAQALSYTARVFTPATFLPLQVHPYRLIVLILLFIGIEWLGRRDAYAIERLTASRLRLVRWGWYSALLVVIVLQMQTYETPFIYFQF